MQRINLLMKILNAQIANCSSQIEISNYTFISKLSEEIDENDLDEIYKLKEAINWMVKERVLKDLLGIVKEFKGS